VASLPPLLPSLPLLLLTLNTTGPDAPCRGVPGAASVPSNSRLGSERPCLSAPRPRSACCCCS
jgi:hypothetical protein